MLLSRQPVGIFAGAAAYLLLPKPRAQNPSSTAQLVMASLSPASLSPASLSPASLSLTALVEVDLLPAELQSLAALLHGNLDVDVPPAWQFYTAAANGDIVGAMALLNQAHQLFVTDCTLSTQERTLIDQWFAYNRLVLMPAEGHWSALRSCVIEPQMAALGQVVAYAYGLSDELPVIDCLSGELRAWAMATLVTQELEQENFLAARQSLAEAVELARPTSPLLASILLSQSAQVAEQCQVPSELIVRELHQAIELAQSASQSAYKSASQPCALRGFWAELHTQLGMVLQRSAGEDRSRLLAAVRAYQHALQSGITSQTHPAMFAELQNNLGLCYLSMPQTESSAQLRTGIAIQSFRYGLESIEQTEHSDLWARISMNLANALQYAPSSHPVENLVQAVEIYEQVLQVRSRARDPIAYALTILNQANALAHLGIFKPALEKASEAYKLFQWYDQGEAAASARELVENINNHLGAWRCDAADGPTIPKMHDYQDQTQQPDPNHTQQEPQNGSVSATAV